MRISSSPNIPISEKAVSNKLLKICIGAIIFRGKFIGYTTCECQLEIHSLLYPFMFKKACFSGKFLGKIEIKFEIGTMLGTKSDKNGYDMGIRPSKRVEFHICPLVGFNLKLRERGKNFLIQATLINRIIKIFWRKLYYF